MTTQNTRQRSPLLIGIDGLSGSGKTSLAYELAALLSPHWSTAIVHLDEIYPGWDGLTTGIELYINTVLLPLYRGHDAQWTPWDWPAHRPGGRRTLSPPAIVILEGVGAAHRSARPLLDAVIWRETPEHLRKQRALQRDGASYAPYWDRWARQEISLLRTDHPREYADIELTPTAQASDVLAALASTTRCKTLFETLPWPHQTVHAVSQPFRGSAEHLFRELFGDSPHAVWLDSALHASSQPPAASGRDRRGRFSIMADDTGPQGRIAWHRRGRTTQVFRGVTVHTSGPFFSWLATHWHYHERPDVPLDFTLGWLGYLGYELGRESGGPDLHPQSADPPEAQLIFSDRAIVIDHERCRLWILELSTSPTPEHPSAWQHRARQLATAERTAPDSPLTGSAHQGQFQDLRLRDDAEAYRQKIVQAQHEIARGNSYEVCLTTRLSFHTDADPFSLYTVLRRANPVPFATYACFGSLTLLGTSPERLLRIDDSGRLIAEPIKGTRPRGTDPQHDATLKEELLSSSKERAENIMIVDLMRNDLSRFADPASLQVTRLCAIESYATVHQMVSTIETRLRSGAKRVAALAAAFPPGSMTGVPKVKTMEILHELEGNPRGPYAGVLGYFSLNGAADLSVVIRTLVLQSQRGFLGLGGAITADSIPEEEWAEVQAKAAGVLRVFDLKFPSAPERPAGSPQSTMKRSHSIPEV